MLCLGLKPGAVGWKAQTNQLSNGDTSGQVSADTRFSRQQLPQKIDNNNFNYSVRQYARFTHLHLIIIGPITF